MIASLPMYDRPETAAVLDTLWSEIRARLPMDAPARLTREGDLWDHWRHPGLILSQTCGYPYRTQLRGNVQLVAAPENRLPGCPPGHYNSVLIVRADDPRHSIDAFATARFAYNAGLSQSGWAAPQTHAAMLGFAFTSVVQTGGHAASVQAVAEGRADIAAIDALSWRLIQRHEGDATALRELARTTPTPALPFITAKGQDAPAIAAALAAAIAALTPEARDTIGLYGLAQIADADYLAVPNPPAPPATHTKA